MEFIIDGTFTAFKLLINLDVETYSAVKATLYTSSISIILALIIGLPIGFILGFYNFFGAKVLKFISDTMLAMPTVAIGLIIYAFITRNGPFGEFGLLFTLKAIVIGQLVLALPIIISLSSSIIENMDEKHYFTIMSYRLSNPKLVMVVIYELRYSLMVVVANAYGRIVAEVGVAMLIGGNIKYFTRTITTAISLETNKGQFERGIALAIVLISIAFLVNLSIHFLKRLDK
ncbi:tungsten ABC transporter TupABC, permease protein [Campylobacter pinnipediorum subsp. caledonicus]|uniref:Tungsten ABC transporter TupABC, permease protein n=1 Tax=Campylobacter pinnipediorum subsp. caledonicus TaxID=1874362 RepID=A0A1S6U8P8_9BACT|nr:tungsten ABC transporter TupABC, permease protein [Campylobacter pinnipediorum subsp. caledonicus]AQW88118.1 tungsten ABC transporter TupABC, permease protein [Campylobacter pinnipediorum subsp. caledonicus]OPA71677.1 ABC transporter permease [Campylobacter pinnipediorum subsp. caledonicus]